jgi:hypothetical protein
MLPDHLSFFVEPIADEAQEEGTPWIGVQLGPIPAALAAHLQLGENKGLIVRNVFQDSPADRAGLQRHDVLARIDDQEVPGTVEGFSKAVRGRKVGDTVRLFILRGGKEMAQDIQLAQAPRPEDLTPKFPEEPDVLYRRDFGLRGRILRPGPHGWEMEDLGELPEMERLFRDYGGGGGGYGGGRNSRDRRRTIDRDAQTAPPDQARRVGRNGETIDVRREKDGTISVRRERRTDTAPAGASESSQVVTYPNEEELRKGDPEAADLLKSQQAAPPSPPGRPDDRRLRPPAPPRTDRDDDRDVLRPRRIPVPSDERWREWRDRFFQRGPDGERFELPLSPAKPNVSFDAQPDGRITVHKRDRDRELSVTYSSREEFRQKAPELYKQFEDMEKTLK